MSVEATAVEPTPERIKKLGDRYVPPKTDRSVSRKTGQIRSVWRALDLYLSSDEILAGERLERHIIGSLHRGTEYGSGRWLDDEESATEFAVTRHSQECSRAKLEIGDRAFQALEQLVNGQFDCNGHLATKPEDIGRAWIGCRQRGQAHAAGVAYIKVNLDRLARMWANDRPARSRSP